MSVHSHNDQPELIAFGLFEDGVSGGAFDNSYIRQESQDRFAFLFDVICCVPEQLLHFAFQVSQLGIREIGRELYMFRM
jgi:hypothetical protein